MFYYCKQVCIILVIVICSDCTSVAEFMTINWNTSTDRGDSDSERDYKYPMYHEIAKIPCDLTTSCDPFCCEDPDCEDDQVNQCPKPSLNCNGLLSFFDCNCDNFDKPEWLSMFCFVYKNPIYLGKFFETPKKIEKSSTLKSVIQKNSLFPRSQKNIEFKAKTTNAFGSAMMTFVPGSSSFPSVNHLLRKVPLKDASYACIHSSVKYRINSKTTCLVKVSQELCQNGHTLGILPYLVQSSKLPAKNNLPAVLKNPDFLQGLKTDVAIKCVQLKSKKMKFKRKIVHFVEEDNVKDCPDVLKAYHTVFTNNSCQNTLAYVKYQFIVNGSDTVELKAEYGLTNISLLIENESNSLNDNIINKYIYLKQTFDIHFSDIMNKSYDNQNNSKQGDIYNRGYFIGEELNFGYKLVKNSTTSWQKGILGVFGNGGSCDSWSPVAFGFHVFSVCYVRQRFPNCTLLRRATEEKFEAHLQGDSLARYANLRPPYSDTVPLLRNFGNSSREDSDNSTRKCQVPVAQDILVQYTSLPTDCGALIHRVVGVRADRTFRDVSTDDDVLLTTRVFFFYVSSSKEKPLSRFWTKMYSQELSSNSWLNIFNAFEDADCDEKKEITFWCSIFVLSGVVVVALTKTSLNVHLGKWL